MANDVREVAATILSQLGGRRFVMMTGANSMVAVSTPLPGLCFRMPKRGRDGSNVWTIALTGGDDYTITTTYFRAGVSKPCSTFEGIYCDQLVELFERESGFFTHF